MSIDPSGLSGVRTCPGTVPIRIEANHPLIQLANSLCWDELADIILPDLKATTGKGKWWMGRPLRLRIHLGAYLLQQLHNLTDRQTEYAIKDNAAYRLFCGEGLVKKWHAPDHTKIEEFRSRLSPETQKNLANIIAGRAVELGFAEPSHVDIDSTIQEANMAYPKDSHLLCKLGAMAKKAADYMNDKFLCFTHKPMTVDLKGIKSIARRYFFLKKTAPQEEKNNRLRELLNYVISEIRLVVGNAGCMGQAFIEEMPWNIKRIFVPLIEKANKYLQNVRHFIDTGSMIPDKLLSFHLNEAVCFTKNKPGKKYQFGRAFQLARVKGNFIFLGKCTDPIMSDKKSLTSMLEEHSTIFNQKPIESLATDKGYYSASNEKAAANHGIEEIGIQRPTNVKKQRIKPLSAKQENELIDRRAGIEPLIGHLKNKGQLGRSRMKSDRTIEASGYTSVLGFNLRQLTRYKMGKISLEAT